MILPTILTSGGVWLYTETVFFLVGLYILATQFYYRAITVRKAIVWAIGFYTAPIVTTIAWMFIGRPVFRRRVKLYNNEGLAEIDTRIASDPSGDSLRVARALSAGGSLPYSDDSNAEYIGSGKKYYELLFQDLRNAKDSICIENYIIRRDEVSREFLDILCTKAREGVKVRILFDDYGYDGGTKKYLRMLEKAGAETHLFHNMTFLLFSPKKNCRNHRKTVVIDGTIGYQGGFNIGDEYIDKGRLGRWRDAAVRITGPQASVLLRSMSDIWEYAVRRPLDVSYSDHCTENHNAGTPIQIVPGNPMHHNTNCIETQFLAYFRTARKRIWIETPYFAPTKEMAGALCTAARSGIDVRIIIPDKGDHPLVYWGNRKFASQLMKAGGRAYEYHDGFLHAKTILVDDRICSIGTANTDSRSIYRNLECNIAVFSKEFASVLEMVILRDLEGSTEYTLESYESRGTVNKIKTIVSAVFREQL